jgi:hypothetical protein
VIVWDELDPELEDDGDDDLYDVFLDREVLSKQELTWLSSQAEL